MYFTFKYIQMNSASEAWFRSACVRTVNKRYFFGYVTGGRQISRITRDRSLVTPPNPTPDG